MPRRLLRWVAIGSAAVLLATGASIAAADPTPPPQGSDDPVGDLATASSQADPYSDDLPNPLEDDRRSRRTQALRDVLSGKRQAVARNGSKVVQLELPEPTPTRGDPAAARPGRGLGPRTVERYVELSRQRTDQVFVLLVDFGNQRDQNYPDADTNADIPGPRSYDGPRQNTIPQPNRRQDNTTLWRSDFSRQFYQDLYFGSGSQSLKSYYEAQSSGRYSLEGEVSDWVTVPYNQARYGRSNGYPCPQNVCGNSWFLVKDALDAWADQQRQAGRTDAAIKETLARYDVWDRYDLDADGNFNEPDGYLDHLQIVHAGGDQAADDPVFGEDAIWSHRWRAFQSGELGAGPPGFPGIGGVRIGQSDTWAADYTMQAENAGMAIYAHEFGHDLGLPDHYDTADPGDNAVNWWTLMGQSRLKGRNDVGVGARAADLGAWDKLQLGWLNYVEAAAGGRQTVELGPHEYNSAKPQALKITLPPKQVVTTLPAPRTGARQWWSGTGNGYSSGLARFLTLPAASSAQLTFQANYNIEDCGSSACDYAYVDIGTGTGAALTFRPIAGTITAATEGNGIDGRSNGWVAASFDLSAYAGQTIALRFRYVTNGATQGADPTAAAGILLDDIAVTADGTPVFADGAENGNDAWALVQGFSNVGSSSTATYPHYYLASYRADQSYDRFLDTGPYNLGWPVNQPQRAEFFPYQHGLLVSYVDGSFTDNNTSAHPGGGLVLPIDARPALLRTSAGQPWRGRVQTYDAPFSLLASDSFVLHADGQPNLIRGQRAQPLFDDTRDYWNPAQPQVGVRTPKLGVTLEVKKQTATTMTVALGARPGSPVAPTAPR